MFFVNAAEADVAAAGGFDADLAFKICLGLGILFLVLAVLFFFLFDIPKVYLIRTGKGARKTIKKMEEVNAETGRLRRVNEDYMLGTDAPMTGDMGQTPSHDISSSSTDPVHTPPPQEMTGGNATTVLGRNETTILSGSETTVLNNTMAVGGNTQKYSYSRKTNGRFDIVFEVKHTHSDEIIP